METIIINSPNKAVTKKIKAFLEPLQVSYKLKGNSEKEHEYDPKFVNKILNTQKEKSTRIDPTKLWESIS